MKSMEISFGQAASHSPMLVQEPKNCSMVSTMLATRWSRSGPPCGSRLRWETFADVNSCAARLGHAATHAPQAMHAAADHEILDHREGGCAPGLYGDLVTVGVVAHVELTGRGAALRSVRLAVD